MALVVADRVWETTSTSGTGTLTLSGALSGYQTFAAIGNGNTTYYTITNGTDWEVGIGTYTSSGTTLSRDTVLSSSSGGSKITVTPGSFVFCDYPADKSVYEDASNIVTVPTLAIDTSETNAQIAPNTGITGWDYSGLSKSIGTEESAPSGLFFSPDGLNMYVNGSTGDDVNQYTLSTAWDVSTATYLQLFSTASQDSAPNDIFFKPDGLTMFVMGQTNDRVFQYTLSTAWNISTASYASKSFSVTTEESTPTGLWFKSDGTVMYVIGTINDTVFQYNLGTAWDVSTASYASISFVVTQESTPNQVNLSADGLTMWIVGATGDDISQYTLGTAWNVSTATFVNNFYIGFQDTNPTGLFIDSTADNRVYMLGTTNDSVYQYNTATNSISAVTDLFNTISNARVQGNLAVQSNAYVDGTLTVQGITTLTGTTTATTFSSSGVTTLATSTAAQTVSLGAGATVSGSTKTVNIGTAGVSGSTTNINIGSAVSGATSTTTVNGSLVVTGGTINGTTIGATTPAAGTFTTITGQTEVLKGTGSNLLLYSEDFSTIWATSGTASVTTNTTTAPDGTNTADTLSNADNITYNTNNLRQNKTSLVSSTPYTFSVYVKSAGATTGAIAIRDNTTGGNTTSSFTPTASWQRVSVTATTSSSTTSVFPTIGGTNGNLYIWGAQLEIGSTANTYIPTTTTAIYGTPTLSFSGVAGLGLQSDGSLYVSPAGTGALQAQATTSSTVGGNARGVNAVDWQTVRSGATRIASALTSVVAGGDNNGATATNSVVSGGTNNLASGAQSFIGSGNGNATSSPYANVVGGFGNTGAGYYNFIGAGQANSGTASAAVTTQSGTMNATTAVTLSGSNANIKVGQYITGTSIAANTYVAAISGTSLTLSQAASGSSTSTLSFFTPHGVVVGGGNNQATGSYSFIGGGGDAGTAANRNVASGDWSFVGGGRGNQATGIASTVGGGGFDGTIVIGNFATAVGSTVVGGAQNIASGSYSTVGGRNCTADGNRSTVFGNGGWARSIRGNYVFAASQDPVGGIGASQAALLILGKQTTDATATALTSNGSAASSDNQVILPNNSAYYFRGEVVSGKTAGGDSKGWEISGLIKRGANAAATTLVGSTVTSLYADAGASTWTIAVTADTTNGGLKVTFTGQAATTIRTVCQIRTTEMTY